MMNITPTVKQLIIINFIFFIGSQFVEEAYQYLALYFPENPNFQVWQPLTHMFMHAGLRDPEGIIRPEQVLHIVFNMLALFSFGSLLENMWGAKKFLFFYFSCGLGAAALHIGINYITFYQGVGILVDAGFAKTEIINLLSQGKFDSRWQEILSPMQLTNMLSAYITPMVGASGAIYGLLVAFAFLVPNAELMLMFIPVPIKAKYFVPGLLLIDLFLGLKGQSIFGSASTGVAHFAHLGGALIGFIMMWYWKKSQFNNNRWN